MFAHRPMNNDTQRFCSGTCAMTLALTDENFYRRRKDSSEFHLYPLLKELYLDGVRSGLEKAGYPVKDYVEEDKEKSPMPVGRCGECGMYDYGKYAEHTQWCPHNPF